MTIYVASYTVSAGLAKRVTGVSIITRLSGQTIADVIRKIPHRGGSIEELVQKSNIMIREDGTAQVVGEVGSREWENKKHIRFDLTQEETREVMKALSAVGLENVDSQSDYRQLIIDTLDSVARKYS